MLERDLFISHSSGDAEAARDLRAGLEAAGYSCWMAPDDVTGTDPWAEQILAAIQNSRAMLILISANANRSAHVSREVNLAIGRGRPVLPIRIENIAPEASLEYLLSLMQRVDAFPLPIAPHLPRIVRRLSTVVPLAATTIGPPVPKPPAEMSEVPPERPLKAVPSGELPTEIAAPAGAAASSGSLGPIGPGSRVGAFTVDAVLGEGGMATVYRATQDEPRRSVALKLIRSDHVADAAYRERFLAEKETLAALEHPSIVPIYAAGEADGRLYIAMRLVDGPDLAGRLAASGRLTLAETIATLRPIADAIDHAHEMGVVHRDLKPSNIILDRRGRAYLTDFGLGKHVDRPRDISVPGVTVGTLDYMAPEQFSGPLDTALAGRIDIYALGCVAYACLTGAPPFRAAEPERVMYGHLHGTIPNILDVRPDLPSTVAAAIGRALSKNPADRFATGDEFLTALAAETAVAPAPPAAGIPTALTIGPSVSVAGSGTSTPVVAAASVEGAGEGATHGLSAPLAAPSPIVASSPIVAPSPPPLPAAGGSNGLSRIGGRARTNTMLAGAAAMIAGVVVVGMLVRSTGGAGPAGTLSLDATQGALASGASSTGTPLGTGTPLSTLGPVETLVPFPSSPTDVATLPPLPTRVPQPTPTADHKAPTGISVAIKGSSITTTKKVNLSLKATGAKQMHLGTASSSTGSCTWTTSWIAYSTSYNGFDIDGGSGAGKRWVCAEFRDAAQNHAGPARDSVTFDRAPVVDNTVTYAISGATDCDPAGRTIALLPYVASDPDASDTLQITKAWSGGSTYPGTMNYSSGLRSNGTQIEINFSAAGSQVLRMYFIVRDKYGVERQGYFTLEINC